ncbi:uncharacterized protein MYCFIDRAFT_198746 [Pseudocercospora fijiensis CIRAD86]|uniref:Uncharacterized protein n=1 Tax=Pseudocercospora fijiensis (strain CIRAD86) TaxID=383855 RepID=M3ATR7_PSEFD|nr:uncharacterized protein MYCFIDRAFT_198746 [Pseudocercospora fijiensis CIRAD86]EME80553.1 hypothetical protein MYCFIDRAFT_198746 [Pseudocercospora fijiensis CIRAD86]
MATGSGTFHSEGGKKINRPDPLIRSSSDRVNEDWMGAGHDPRSVGSANNTKPLPAQSQASPVLNLFTGYKGGRNGAQQASWPGKPIYDPQRATEIRRHNSGSQTNYSWPSSRSTSPALRDRQTTDFQSSHTQSDAAIPAIPSHDKTTSGEKEKWTPRALLKAREFGQWDTAWQLEKSFEIPHENDDKISQKLRDEIEAARTPKSKQTSPKNERKDMIKAEEFRKSEESDNSSLALKSSATNQTFSSIENSLADDKAQRKPVKDTDKLLKQALKKRSVIQKLETRAKDEGRSENWTELQVLVAKIDKEKTELLQLEGRIATLRGEHPADEFLKTGTAQEAGKRESVSTMKSKSAPEPVTLEASASSQSKSTGPSSRSPDAVIVAPQPQPPASSSALGDSISSASVQDEMAKSAEPKTASPLSPTFPAGHPLVGQEKTLIRDILECEHRISDWIGVVAKAVTSEDVLLKQRAWQYKTNEIPQFSKYVALRREELAKLRAPQPEPVEDPLESHEPTQLSDIEDGPEHAMGPRSPRPHDSTLADSKAGEVPKNGTADPSHDKKDTVRWPLLEEKEDYDLKKLQPQGLQASMWTDPNSPSDEKDRLNSLDWAMLPTKEQIIEVPAKAAGTPDTPGLFSIAPRRRSKNVTEEEAARLKEAAAVKTPPAPSSPPIFSPEKASFASGAEASPSDKLHRRSKSVSSALPSPVSVHSTRRPSSGTFASGQAPKFVHSKTSPLEPRFSTTSAQLTRDLDYSSLEKSYNDVLEKLKSLTSEREYWERKARGLGDAEHQNLTEQLSKTKAELSLTHDQRDYWMRIANDRGEEIEELKGRIASLEKEV